MTTTELQTTPSEELATFLADAVNVSTAGESTCRKDFPCDDAVLVVTSHAGGEIEYTVEPKELHKYAYPEPEGLA
jgi:hypothetical protein